MTDYVTFCKGSRNGQFACKSEFVEAQEDDIDWCIHVEETRQKNVRGHIW